MIQVRLDHIELIEIGEQWRRGIIHSAPLVQPRLDYALKISFDSSRRPAVAGH
jgi:hypothetical protein